MLSSKNKSTESTSLLLGHPVHKLFFLSLSLSFLNDKMKKIFFGLFLFNIFLNSLFLVNPVLDYSDNVVVYILDLLVLPADDIIVNNAVRYFHKKCSTVSLLTMQYGIITNTTVQFNCKHCWAQNLRQGIVLKTSWISIFLIWNIILFSLFIFSIFFRIS